MLVYPCGLTSSCTVGSETSVSSLQKRFIDRVPMGRPAEPEEAAAVIAFLAGSDTSYLNGVHIPVDGGLTASNGQTNLYRSDD
ncbi:SDR family oxidoreductase [Streptomyces sp. NPDC046984]|uniref:SDR family oxidoreductase n=1 Tax=Streptomyces sp. NPDC046984 TaxID=3155138 RepID=UPI0033F0C447